jgi:hypothetical protein
MGEGSGSRLDVEATNDALRGYDRNRRFNTMAGMPKVRHCNDARPH